MKRMVALVVMAVFLGSTLIVAQAPPTRPPSGKPPSTGTAPTRPPAGVKPPPPPVTRPGKPPSARPPKPPAPPAAKPPRPGK